MHHVVAPMWIPSLEILKELAAYMQAPRLLRSALGDVDGEGDEEKPEDPIAKIPFDAIVNLAIKGPQH